MALKMRAIRVKTVIQLTCFPKLFPVNCYFIEEDDGLTLIDAALPGCSQSILEAAASIGKPITRIVLTHAHNDHIGALPELKRRLPAAKVYISARDARLLSGDISLDAHEQMKPIRGGVPKSGTGFPVPDVLLADGDRVGSLLAIAAPGHTPGSMAFIDSRNHQLIAGDAFQTRGGVAVSGHMKLRFPFPALATWDREASVTSALKLCALRPTLLAAGHGEMLAQPIDLMQKAVDAAKKGMS